MSEKSEIERTPFEERLVDSEFHADSGVLFEFENDPSKVVRFFRKFSEDNLEDHLGQIKAGKNELEKLSGEYGVNLPIYDIVVGHKDQNQIRRVGAYYITDKINGVNLKKLLEARIASEEDLENIDQVLSGVVNYLIDEYQKSGPVLDDLGSLCQYVYGVSPDQTNRKRKLFLVDIDPLTTEGEFKKMAIKDSIRFLESELSGYSRGDDFCKTREVIERAKAELDLDKKW